MKTKYLSIAFALLALTSCSKDKENLEPEYKGNVEYIIRCNCIATIDVAAGKKTVTVQGEASVWDTNNLSNLTVTTVGQGDSEVNIKVDELSVYFQLKSMTNGSAVHTVKVVR